MAVDDELQANYRELSASTGESFDSIAARVDAMGDAGTAAWLRSQAAQESPAVRSKTPKGRRGAGPQETASA